MNDFFRIYACTNAEIVLLVIRIVIGIILLIRVKSIMVNLKKVW